jgi:hypothetical protein
VIVQNNKTVNYTFRWRNCDDDKRDTAAAERERLRDDGKCVASIGWGDDGKLIEHEAGPLPSNNRRRRETGAVMLFTTLDRRIHLARAARLITECRACIPGRRVYHQCSMDMQPCPSRSTISL